ncbi:MAG: hypothetical protein IJW33_05470 [Lentisphaeria bacterium]|nr:hypothetical protein [Lentisphaeria bacterium]
MKKMILLAAAALMLCAVTGCGSARTPKTGANSKYTYYQTFFGLSLESAVYGDGLVLR